MRGMISAQTARRAVWRPLWELPRRFDLIWPLARRMTLARYRGSALGLLWALLTPAVMIAVFTFLFAGIFGARFTPEGTPWDCPSRRPSRRSRRNCSAPSPCSSPPPS
jgi:hypothetical protein